MTEIKIVQVINSNKNRIEAEQTIAALVNDGWRIVAAAGGDSIALYIILQRESVEGE